MRLHAYPAAWPRNEATQQAARRWQRRGLLTAAQQAAIEAAHPVGYYRPVLWLRLGLFGATVLAVSASLWIGGALTGLLLPPVAYGLLGLVGCLTGLEVAIASARHYRSGLDNALLYCALLAWAFVVSCVQPDNPAASLTDGRLSGWLLLLLPALLGALLRYADPVVAAASFGAVVALLANLLLQSTVGQLLLPAGLLAVAGAWLLALRRLPARADYWYYHAAGRVLRVLALALLYLAGNYLVVREGSAALLAGGPAAQVPLAPFFYGCTGGVPLAYIGLGLRGHDRLLLAVGLLALAFSLFTLRHYRALLPPEVAATVGGAVLLALALAALRYLRTPRHGFTAAADDEASPHLNLENFVVAQAAAAPAAPAAGWQFGGGHSGGGGAAGKF